MSHTMATPEQNAEALNHFIYLPVSKDMVSYLALKASQVIRCDNTPVHNTDLPQTPPITPTEQGFNLSVRKSPFQKQIQQQRERSSGTVFLHLRDNHLHTVPAANQGTHHFSAEVGCK